MTTNVTVLGTGFAALTAVRKLRAADKDLEITVVAPEPELVCLPSLIWLPSGQRKPEDIVIPLDGFFAETASISFKPKPGIRLGEKVVPKLMRRMEKLGIATYLGDKMVRFEENKIVTEGGEFAADLILFMPGMTGNAWFNNTDLPRSPGGLVEADSHCRVAGFERLCVAGDSTSFPGPDWMPKQAHMADLQAAAAAKNLIAELNGQPGKHIFRVELFCIVDDNSTGALVARTPRLSLTLPPMGLAHLSKNLFERFYLRRCR